MLLQTIPEGLGLGALLVLVCAVGIHKGAVGMAHLYDAKVQERCVALGLTTKEKIKQNSLRFKLICVPGYLAYVLICVYAINGAHTFWDGFWQCFVILSVIPSQKASYFVCMLYCQIHVCLATEAVGAKIFSHSPLLLLLQRYGFSYP